jgi:basic amino acid/polyamine antiporter, APA family
LKTTFLFNEIIFSMSLQSLFRRKSLSKLLENHENESAHGNGMEKSLGLWDLVSMGIAAVIGAGIFSTIGDAAFKGGPGVIFLFVITAVTCGFAAMCYAEFASRVPVSGSAYTYSYVTFGELAAWIIGWMLILEYAIGNIVVAISWSDYFNHLLKGVGIHLPEWLTMGYGKAVKAAADPDSAYKNVLANAPTLLGFKFIINLPAFMITVLVTILAYLGIKESKRIANSMVILKLLVLAVVILIGIFYVTPANWTPFMPKGFGGVMQGVSAVFFAYIGFDAISTTAEECKNPRRDLPKGMILSLIICTVVYILTTLVITGMVNYSKFEGVKYPLAFVFDQVNLSKLGFFVSVCAVVAATSVLLVFQLGQPRIWMSMSRDGLLPKRFSTIHPKFKTPSFATILTGFVVAVPALLIDDAIVLDLTSIGTLFAFLLVSAGVLALPQRTDKEDSKFKLPYINGAYVLPILLVLFVYIFKDKIMDSLNFGAIADAKKQLEAILYLVFVGIFAVTTIFTVLRRWSSIPVLGALCCLYLMIEIPAQGWIAFFVWVSLGLAVYFMYGRRNSVLNNA